MQNDFLRNRISRYFTKQNEIIFHNQIPSKKLLAEKLSEMEELGIYLHIPFCNRICPYCPYNKEIFTKELSRNYFHAVLYEIDTYASLLGHKPVTSFYIGGGTPTTMLGLGIEQIIDYIYKRFNMDCGVHMESHPNHLTPENLDTIESMGVKYLSIGVESLQDRHLKILERPYNAKEVKKTIERAVDKNFECVNIDYIFDLPGQTGFEIEQAGREMVELGIQQAATYPLFRFPYTRFSKKYNNRNSMGTMFRRRRFLKILESIFYDSGYERSSVWAFTKKGVDKYCSVTVPSYLGLGASGSTYLNDIFYVNTFSVKAYISSINEGKLPISLSTDLSEEMQMAGWLYWRIYETRFKKSDFQKRFDTSFNAKYGRQMDLLKYLGYLNNGSDQISLTDKGAYWIHAFEDYFSINYINKLWGKSRVDPWPDEVIL
ncbi:MAG: radical SAM protein [Bacteroidales bacterium]|nr:radical SAM protein [Bacteroidales bacterium]